MYAHDCLTRTLVGLDITIGFPSSDVSRMSMCNGKSPSERSNIMENKLTFSYIYNE